MRVKDSGELLEKYEDTHDDLLLNLMDRWRPYGIVGAERAR